MVKILPSVDRGYNSSAAWGSAVGNALKSGMEKYQKDKKLDQENEQIKKNFGVDLSGVTDPDERKIILGEMLRRSAPEKSMTSLQQSQEDLNRQKIEALKGTQEAFGNIFGKSQEQNQMELPEENQSQSTKQPRRTIDDFSDEDLTDLASFEGQPGEMGIIANQAKMKLQERKEKGKATRQEFKEERQYHSSYSKEAEKEADQLRQSIPKKEMAMDFARNAVETGELSYFSPDKLADATGIDLFRTAKGAQLITAGKENLLSNMSRVSARAQNQWFEQRLNSMFAKIGQNKEANLTVQEMLEGELALDKAYLNSFDKISKEDEEKYGFVKKDITKRSREAIKPYEKEILKRTSYRMKEIEENEKGLSKMREQLGKNVPKGTPLTLAMAKLYKSKFGENALNVAEKNGYYIPTVEEFTIFQQRPEEFREGLSG